MTYQCRICKLMLSPGPLRNELCLTCYRKAIAVLNTGKEFTIQSPMNKRAHRVDSGYYERQRKGVVK